MLKILIILIRFPGGVGTSNKEIAEVLRKKGHKVDFLSREDDLGIYSFKSSIFPIRKRVQELMVKNNYDIIYSQDHSMTLPLLIPYPLYPDQVFHACIGIKRSGTQKIIQYLVGRVMNKKTIVINDYNHKRFPKSHLVYRGVNLKRFKPLGKKRVCLGWINKFSEQLDSKIYKKIAKEVGLKPIYAGGSGKSKSTDKAYGKTIIHSFDKIPDDKMNEFYNKCKVFVNCPTSDAGFNLSWLEAMSSGVKIIIGNEEGAGKILPIYKVNSPSEIKEIVETHKKDFDYRKWIIDNDFTWENCVKKLIKIFEK